MFPQGNTPDKFVTNHVLSFHAFCGPTLRQLLPQKIGQTVLKWTWTKLQVESFRLTELPPKYLTFD